MKYVIVVITACLLAVLTGCPYKTTQTISGEGEDKVTVVRTEMDATNLMRFVTEYGQMMADLDAELRDPATTEERRLEILDTINAYNNGLSHAILSLVIHTRAVMVANQDRVIFEAKGNRVMVYLEQGEKQ